MKAMVMTAVGGPEVLQWQEVPNPEAPQGHELLIRLRAAGVNPVDTKLRARGTYFPERMPAILGCDGAGVVEATGDKVRRFKPGDAVYFCHGGLGAAPGCYAEFTLVHEHCVAHKPAQLDFAHAAAAPLVLITAWESLHERSKLRQGKSVLVHAGAGGIGHVAIQLVKRAGAWCCTTVSDEDKAQFVRELGADAVIRYRDGDFVPTVLDWTEGEGTDIALDTVGGTVFTDSFRAVRCYGDLVTLLQPASDVDWKDARLRNLRVSFELMLTPQVLALRERQQRQAEILERCAPLFDAGELTLRLAETLPITDAAEAHRRIERGGMLGKLALVFE
jgi:NADPH2:quinone reductase